MIVLHRLNLAAEYGAIRRRCAGYREDGGTEKSVQTALA
jgi:hypothetical protein